MENKIKLFEVRDFGQKFNATFAFLSREFKPFIITMFKILGIPLLLTMLLSGLNTAFQFESIGMADPQFGPMVFVVYFLFLIIYSLATVAVASYVKIYNDLTDPDEKVTSEAVWRVMRGKVFPSILLSILYFIAVLIGFVFLIIPGIYLAIALSLSHVILVMEDTDVISSLSRSAKLVNQEFFPTLGFVFILSLVTGIAASFLQIPATILGVLVGFSSAAADGSFNIPVWVTMLVIAIPGMFAYSAYLVNFLGNAFVYGNLREQQEAPGIMAEIDNFGKRDETADEDAIPYL